MELVEVEVWVLIDDAGDYRAADTKAKGGAL